MASTKSKPVGPKEEDYHRIVAAMSNIPAQLKKIKKEKGTHLVISRNGKIEHVKSEDIKI